MILRAHYESLASVNYFRKYPDKREQLTWGDKYTKKKTGDGIISIHVNNMLRELDKDIPSWSVMEDHEEMSQIVHPNRKSHLANIKPKEDSKNIFNFSLFISIFVCDSNRTL